MRVLQTGGLVSQITCNIVAVVCLFLFSW